MSALVVTDTHALIWYATGATRKLGRKARPVFECTDTGRAAVHVPTIALVEIAEEIRKGTIDARRAVLHLVREALLERQVLSGLAVTKDRSLRRGAVRDRRTH